MSPPQRLLKVGSMAGSMAVYVPAVALQRLVALARVLVFIHLLPKAQYGLWGLGAMIFAMGAPIITLGSHLGLARYVSFFEARGMLAEFLRRIRWPILAIAAAMTALAFAGSERLTALVMASRAEDPGIWHGERLRVCWAALINAMLMGLYHNVQSFLAGMRAYRLSAAMEVFYAAVFTALGVGALWAAPTAMSALLAHAAALALTLLAGTALLHKAVGVHAAAAVASPGDVEAAAYAPQAETPELTGQAPIAAAQAQAAARGPMRLVLGFGLVALAGSFLWLAAGYVSFWMTSRRLGQAAAGGFYAFLQLGQVMFFLANAAWAVVFTHVAKRWESNDRQTAMFTLQTAYKAVAMATMTLTIIVFVTSGLWSRVLPESYRQNLPVLGGLLMFFQVMTNLALTTMLANLRRRPVVVAVLALAGGGTTAALASWWLGPYGSQGAAWAAGIGMYLGSAAVSAAYFVLARAKLQWNTLFVFASPALLAMLLAPSPWPAAGLWGAVLAAALLTDRLFCRREKDIMLSYLLQAVRFLRRGGK